MLAMTDKGNLEGAFGSIGTIIPLPDPVREMVMMLVKPGMEREARDAMRRRGVGAWWPNYPREVGAKDRETGKRFKRLIWNGVLPGVVLCKARLDKCFWEALDHAPGAMNVVRKSNTDVVLLSETDIALIHKIEEGLNKTLAVKGGHSYAVGDNVRIVADDLRRMGIGNVVRCAKDGIVTVEVNMFGRLTPWDFLPEQIEPVDSGLKNQTASRSTDARDRPAKSPSKKRNMR